MVKKGTKTKAKKRPAKPKVRKTAKVVEVTQKPTKEATKIEIVVKTEPTKIKKNVTRKKTTTKKRVVKKKPFVMRTTKKRVVKKRPVKKKVIKKVVIVEKFPKLAPEKKKVSFFSGLFKRKKKVKEAPKPISRRKVGKRQKYGRVSIDVKEKKKKLKFSIWWILPPFLRPAHAKVVSVPEEEVVVVSATKAVQQFKHKPATMDDSKTITTGIDRLLALIEEKGKITVPEIRVRLGLTEEITDEWISLLESHKFIVLYYPTFGPAELMSPDFAAKNKLKKEKPIKELEKPKEEKKKPAKPKEKRLKLPFRRKKNE